MTDRGLLTTREVGRILGLSPESVLRLWRRGELPGFRLRSNVLRFDPADVDAFLASRRRDVTSEPPCWTRSDAVRSLAPPSEIEEAS